MDLTPEQHAKTHVDFRGYGSGPYLVLSKLVFDTRVASFTPTLFMHTLGVLDDALSSRSHHDTIYLDPHVAEWTSLEVRHLLCQRVGLQPTIFIVRL